MSMHKKNLLIAIIIVAIVFLLGFITGSFSISYGGLFHVGGRYYKTPTKAFEVDYIPTATDEKIEILNAIDTVIIDDKNCLFLATTKGGNLLVAPMNIKDNKYHYYGEHYLYNKGFGDYDSDVGLITNKTSLYATNGIVSNEYEWCILFEDYSNTLLNESTQIKEYSPPEFTKFYLALF